MLAVLLTAILAVWVTILLVYGRTLLKLWREPVFRDPVLVFESDDWGPGPREHAEALTEIAELLGRYRDGHGRHPVMTLGVTLAIPAQEPGEVDELTLADTRFEDVKVAMERGVEAGVFRVQLHGRSHYWLPAVKEAACSDPAVDAWLGSQETWHTESLPPALQSRWGPLIGGQEFPIADATKREAAENEARLFHAIFKQDAIVAVPPTFVWDDAVEQGWAAAGVQVVVTPGERYVSRAAMEWTRGPGLITNGMGNRQVRYVVRDRYFEPYRGHAPDDGLRALEANSRLGRPTLLEIHRVNFLEPGQRKAALEAMAGLLDQALDRFPGLRFLATEELDGIVVSASPESIRHGLGARVAVWCGRARTRLGFWRLARVSGLAVLIILGERVAGRA